MSQTYGDVPAAMGTTDTPETYPSTSDAMTAALNAALEAGDLENIMGRMARAH